MFLGSFASSGRSHPRGDIVAEVASGLPRLGGEVPLRPPPSCRQGGGTGSPVSAPHPSKPQLPGFDSGPAGSGIIPACGHRLRGQRGQSRTTGCPRWAEGAEGPALSGAVLLEPGLTSEACPCGLHAVQRARDGRLHLDGAAGCSRPRSREKALVRVSVSERSADRSGAVAFADVPWGRWV